MVGYNSERPISTREYRRYFNKIEQIGRFLIIPSIFRRNHLEIYVLLEHINFNNWISRQRFRFIEPDYLGTDLVYGLLADWRTYGWFFSNWEKEFNKIYDKKRKKAIGEIND